VPLPHPEIFEAILPGHGMMVDDGKIRLKVTAVDPGVIEAEIVTGGPVLSRKGVNLPDTILDLSPLTDKDRTDLAYGIDLGVDYVALSFVQQPSDCMECRSLMADGQGLVSKIEKPKALERWKISFACQKRSWWRAAILASRSRLKRCRAARSR
jgi:pyruvate kinase